MNFVDVNAWKLEKGWGPVLGFGGWQAIARRVLMVGRTMWVLHRVPD